MNPMHHSPFAIALFVFGLVAFAALLMRGMTFSPRGFTNAIDGFFQFIGKLIGLAIIFSLFAFGHWIIALILFILWML